MKNIIIVFCLSISFFSGCSKGDSTSSKIDEFESAFSGTDSEIVARKIFENKNINLSELGNLDAYIGIKGQTLLWVSYISNQVEAFEQLLREGADPNKFFSDNKSVGELVIRDKNTKFLKILLENDMDPNAMIPERDLPIAYYATSDSSVEVLDLLLKYGLDVNSADGAGNTLAIICSTKRQVEVLNLLISYGADPLRRNEAGIDVASGLYAPNWPDSGEASVLRKRVIDTISSSLNSQLPYHAPSEVFIRNFDDVVGSR